MLIEGKTQEVLANQLLTSILSEFRPGVWRDNSAAFGVDRANGWAWHWQPGCCGDLCARRSAQTG